MRFSNSSGWSFAWFPLWCVSEKEWIWLEGVYRELVGYMGSIPEYNNYSKLFVNSAQGKNIRERIERSAVA